MVRHIFGMLWWDGSHLLLLGSLLLASGCSTSRRDPQSLRGEPLPLTGDYEPAHSVLTVSRDGEWLLFESVEGTWHTPAFVLYNLEETRRYPVIASPDIAARLANVQLDGRMAYFDAELSAFVLPTPARNAYFSISPIRQTEGTSIDFEDQALTRSSSALPPAAERFVNVQRISSRELALMTSGLEDPPRYLARHRLSGILENHIELSDIRISWDRRFISYRVIGTRGGSFSLPSQGYVVPLNGSSLPVLLGSPVLSPICWHPRGDRVFAYAVGSKGLRAIFTWQLDGLL